MQLRTRSHISSLQSCRPAIPSCPCPVRHALCSPLTSQTRMRSHEGHGALTIPPKAERECLHCKYPYPQITWAHEGSESMIRSRFKMDHQIANPAAFVGCSNTQPFYPGTGNNNSKLILRPQPCVPPDGAMSQQTRFSLFEFSLLICRRKAFPTFYFSTF